MKKGERVFRVYFKDGNQRLYEAVSMVVVLNRIEVVGAVEGGYTMKDVAKIEEVEA